MTKLIEVNYGLSSNYGEITEINWKLKDELREKIRKHETRHSSNRHYSKEDFMNDFQSENSYFFESLKFAIMNPECLIGFFPYMFSYYFKEMTFNKSAMIPFVYFGILFTLVCSGVISFVLKSNFFKVLLFSVIAYILFVALINGLLLLYTHYHVKKENWFVYKEVLD